MELEIPKQIKTIADVLIKNEFEVNLVGGCVRDLILGLKPSDWDLTTNAPPEEIQSLFEHTVYENKYGTVGIVLDNEKDRTLKLIEITPYRKDGVYKNNRHPEKVLFCGNIEEDLKRRDFTINAIAYDLQDKKLIDLFGGIQDLNKKIIRTVGDPDARFNEDGLRMLRSVRFATKFNVDIEEKTKKSICKNKDLLENISTERIRDEFVKIIQSENSSYGLNLLEALGILKILIPELREGIGMEQNQAHTFDVYNHLLKTLEAANKKRFTLVIRLSALFHDIGKPRTREWQKNKNDWSFHNHEVVGAKMTKEILKRMKFSNKLIDEIVSFVRWHMFFSDTEKITLSGVRKMIVRIGEDKIWDLINLRVCDRIGTGRPKEEPYKLRKYKAMVEEALKAPTSTNQLKLDGNDLMKTFDKQGGKWLGAILIILLNEVIEDNLKNDKKELEKRAGELHKLEENDLLVLARDAKQKLFALEQKEIQEIRGKYFVN